MTVSNFFGLSIMIIPIILLFITIYLKVFKKSAVPALDLYMALCSPIVTITVICLGIWVLWLASTLFAHGKYTNAIVTEIIGVTVLNEGRRIQHVKISYITDNGETYTQKHDIGMSPDKKSWGSNFHNLLRQKIQ